jgi:hypothetical protein
LRAWAFLHITNACSRTRQSRTADARQYLAWNVKRSAPILFILGICIFAPNLIWLGNSTARITNGGTDTINSVIVHVDDEETRLGDLLPGESRFIFLPKSGDATYKVSYVDENNSPSVCEEYVEDDMYHMETVLDRSQGSGCEVSLPLFSEVLILKVI